MVRYERTGAAAVVTIDRPERRNAVDGPTAAELLAAYERFAADDDARVMVLTGTDVFCAGADLKALETLDPDAPGGPLGFTRIAPAKPAIAAIRGWCVAGGLELALWCDLRVAGEDAKFGCLERRWGVPLIDGGTQRLPRVVGLGRALDLILTGRTVEATEAHAMGLVTEIAADPLARALELAEAIAAFPQETMLSDREAAYAAQGLPLAEGIALEARLGRERVTGALEGARRFRVGP
jgi:enoyl-CoA hydratase